MARVPRVRKLVVAALAGTLALLAACSSAPARDGVKVVRYDVRSRFVHRTLAQTAVLPPGGGEGRPLLVFLHGRGQAGNESNANGAFYAALRAQGSRAPVVVFPNGGDHSYFHARGSGDWARYVLDEVIPRAVKRFGADPGRVAIGGISMGGFGAFAIARKRPARFCAVGGHSAAFWQSSGETAPGAFDNAADFARNDLIRLARARGRKPWGDARLWLDGGTADPFRAADERLAAALHIRMRHWAGGHDGNYWQSHYKRYLRFYADALAAC
jgi:enterochelin esterase-like enzyme